MFGMHVWQNTWGINVTFTCDMEYLFYRNDECLTSNSLSCPHSQFALPLAGNGETMKLLDAFSRRGSHCGVRLRLHFYRSCIFLNIRKLDGFCYFIYRKKTVSIKHCKMCKTAAPYIYIYIVCVCVRAACVRACADFLSVRPGGRQIPHHSNSKNATLFPGACARIPHTKIACLSGRNKT